MQLDIHSRKHGSAIVYFDDADYDIIKSYTWRLMVCGISRYAASYKYIPGKNFVFLMHRILMNAGSEMEVDHRDNNGLNNHRHNLRIATHAENNRNKPIGTTNTTGFKGVFSFKDRFKVQIVADNKSIHGGYFYDIIEAAKRYNELAKQYHGEFANLNIIPS